MRMRPFSPALVVVWLLLAALVPSVLAQTDDDEPEYRSGLVATFTRHDGSSFTRVDEDVQLDSLIAGSEYRPDARLGIDEPWQANWQGRLFTIVPGTYRIHLYVVGKVKVAFKGQTLLDADSMEPRWIDSAPFESNYGHHPITIEYVPPKSGARLGLYWSGPQFALEPIPDRHWFHDPAHTPTSAFESGRLLAQALQCAQCHRQPDDSAAPRGPDLSRLKGQIHAAWIVDRLTAPVTASNESADVLTRSTRMPHFVMPEADATAIASW
ncbi:MAG: c-type cytochrome, partial [Planctomycetaceae bacterium]|nr:c-type cytochrome [Planctomycetaceae bacterium]